MIKAATPADAGAITKMAVKLWPEHTTEELKKEFEGIIGGRKSAVFLLVLEEQPVGFAQCQLRNDYVEGTGSSPVGYLEGIFIEQDFRRKGYARELLAACEDWSRKQGCTEFASDCELGNRDSLAFHLSMGFSEANRIICFVKKM